MTGEALKSTPLTPAHEALGARMTPFAGYAMPVSYPAGMLKEHQWTRAHAGVFDVSHMGPAWLELARPTGDAEDDHRAVAGLIEPLVCGDIRGLRPGHYQVWLYNSILDARSIGQADGRRFTVTASLPGNWKRFKFVDVSREPREGNPSHSGESVLRTPTASLR